MYTLYKGAKKYGEGEHGRERYYRKTIRRT